VEVSSPTAHVVDSQGKVIDEGKADFGELLRCVLPIFPHGPTSEAVLSVEHVTFGPLLQRVCLDRGCGYASPDDRATSGSSFLWWADSAVGVGGLHGKKMTFRFDADLCSPGYLSPFGGALPWCQKCESGKFAPFPGAISCALCPRGTWAREGATSCTLCPAGKTSADVASERPEVCAAACPSGTFGPLGGIAPCLPCPMGSFSNETGATGCTHCGYGFGTLPPQDAMGATGCDVTCAAGTVGVKGFPPCQLCPPGEYSPLPGAQQCHQCSPGTFSTLGIASLSLSLSIYIYIPPPPSPLTNKLLHLDRVDDLYVYVCIYGYYFGIDR